MTKGNGVTSTRSLELTCISGRSQPFLRVENHLEMEFTGEMKCNMSRKQSKKKKLMMNLIIKRQKDHQVRRVKSIQRLMLKYHHQVVRDH
jgi:hypothetical protein